MAAERPVERDTNRGELRVMLCHVVLGCVVLC